MNLSAELREKAIAVYREKISEEDKEWVREQYRRYGEDWSVQCGWHFYGGMTARNMLREAGLPDSLTPSGNWDDHYDALVLVACGVNDSQDIQVDPLKKQVEN